MVVGQSGGGSQYFPQKLKITRGFEYGPLLDFGRFFLLVVFPTLAK
jgi:hypothetical protein